MMEGKFKEYNWNDILALIYKDMGLENEQEQRERGSIWFTGGFMPPECQSDTIIRAQTYDKDWRKRTKEHIGEKDE